MTKKTILSFWIFAFIFTALNANENRIKREFTVTTIALDAENTRLENEKTDENNTTIQGGVAEEN
jgi:hypothetical protein